MIVAGIEFPNECPKDCPFTGDIMMHGQNSICGRCPLFCCSPCQDDDESPYGAFCLVEPEQYRPDWAKVWRRWFDDGMQGYPVLPLASPGSVER